MSIFGQLVNHVSIVTSSFLHRISWTPQIRSRHDLRVVFYHGIGDRLSPCMRYLEDEISMASFVRQIELLRHRYRLVSLEDGVAAMLSGDRWDNPLCCITFDDGLSSVFSKAYPLLASQGIPAAVFVNTSVVGNRRMLWQHVLNYLLYHHGIRAVFDSLKRHAGWTDDTPLPHTAMQLLELCRARFGLVYETSALDKTVREFDIDIEAVSLKEHLYLDWNDIATMSCNGFTFHSHTANHLPLRVVHDDVMRWEIDEARDVLTHHLRGSDRFISFPFGMRKDFGRRASEYALASGYQHIIEVEDGWNPRWRVQRGRSLTRVCLGVVGSDSVSVYAALELMPLLKGTLNALRARVSAVPA